MTLLDRIAAAPADAFAAIDDKGQALTYRQLREEASRLAAGMAGDKRLVLLECDESVAWLTAYVACLQAGHACLLLPPDAREMRERLTATFRPGFLMAQANGFSPRALANPATAIDPALSTMLSTSGSTGSAKCVRLSYANMAANAAAIAEYLELGPDERGLVNLPTHYSYGLSIVNSHLHAGATLLFTAMSVLQPAFWTFAREQRATSFAGVPHSYDLIERLGLTTVAPPTLRYFTQAGGKLAPAAVARFATLAEANGWRFFVMYGQTEAGPRIAYLPPDRAAAHPDAIGLPVPGGTLRIEDESGAPVPDGTAGELVFAGPNVMMGYATQASHMADGAGPAELRTGDIALRGGDDGLFRITGRLSRFIKVFGNRISLDEVERICADGDLPVIATGIDEHLLIATRDAPAREAILDRVTGALSLPRHSVEVRAYDEYPLLTSGKVDYAAMKASIVPDTLAPTTGTATPGPIEMGQGLAGEADAWSPQEREIAAIWRDALGVAEMRRDDTFFDVGGDSLSAINVMLRMEAAGIPAKMTQQIFEGRSIAEIAASRDGAVASTPATRAQTSDAIIMTRAITVFAVFASHWLPFVLVRMGSLSDTLVTLAMPLFRFATPAFAMIYGVGLTFFNMSLLRKRPERLAANMRLNTMILLGGVLVMALFRAIAFYLERTPLQVGPLVYGVLLSYLLLVMSSVPVLRLLGARKEPVLAALLLALTSFLLSELVRELWHDDDLSDLMTLLRLLIVEKYGYFQMLGYALLGAAAGLWLDGAQASGRVPRQALLAGLALIELSALLTFVLGRGAAWFAGTATIEMIVAFAGAVLAIFALMLAAVRRGVFAGALKVPGRLLLIVGMLAFLAYVGHELTMSLHHILTDMALPYVVSLVLSVGLFAVVMAIAMRRLYRLYYGGGE